MTPTRNRLRYAAVTTLVAAGAYVLIGQRLGTPLAVDPAQLVALAAIFAASWLWAPGSGRNPR
jgi:hypothetical protein